MLCVLTRGPPRRPIQPPPSHKKRVGAAMRAWSPKRRLQAACDERMRAKVCTLATAAATGAFILMLLVVSGLSGSTLEDQRFWRQPATAATAATLSRPPGRVHSQPVVTDRPLVGILAQECFTCPGRCVIGVERRQRGGRQAALRCRSFRQAHGRRRRRYCSAPNLGRPNCPVRPSDPLLVLFPLPRLAAAPTCPQLL